MTRIYSDQEKIRREKLNELINHNLNPYLIETITTNTNIASLTQQFSQAAAEELLIQTTPWTLTGRVMAIRQTFLVLKKENAKLQIYFNKKHLDPLILDQLKKYVDIGDLLWVEGNLFFTKLGELTLNVQNFQIIAKCLHPLPEKHHGLKDPELRLRKRYLDAIVNDEILATFKMRSQVINYMREFLVQDGYLEVETPFLNPTLGGAAARPFITKHNTLDQDFYLRIALELPLKKMVVAGFDKVFEIGRCFRNEGMDATHNPEYTSLEMYTAFEGMEQTINRCEALVKYISAKTQIHQVHWNQVDIDLTPPFQRVSMAELVKAKTGIDFYHETVNLDQALKLADQYQISLKPHQKTVGHIFTLLFEHLCEADLIQPTFVYGHHKDVSPLAKADPHHPDFTLRFELFIGKKEIANGFAELNDPIDQLNRFEAQLQEASLGNDEANEIDHEFIDALEYGLVPTGGLGVGVDRLVMIFTQQDTIKNVIFFPHLKKENK
ncbi:lysyl-tRNA synthetase class 2 [Mycoplasmoides fastidiosum]|uniref:Lysine--tRNA ligase n=1 Tax=Mycoplasmoides fastidiosum TaxID=92758 RepID=A0ABU0M0F0_9BACT|nr:lysine--tRNA ligase [Mycoplasmoides fastidiosum]MDQ0514320.1 lysyl-tRNA synthetase class 2 [Mycoplasmoides fastidiosum]UUD38077.1 lysine--tRNA ligase [Mycoplasmoides fastidiosum]